jgi:hypothetical protein
VTEKPRPWKAVGDLIPDVREPFTDDCEFIADDEPTKGEAVEQAKE